MPKWNEYKTSARERGSLAAEFFVVRTSPSAPPEKMQEVLPRHLAYQIEQQNAHRLAFAGPLSDPTGEEMMGEGLIIYRADSLEEARQLADNDPMHAEGCRTYEIRKWLINGGHWPEALHPLANN